MAINEIGDIVGKAVMDAINLDSGDLELKEFISNLPFSSRRQYIFSYKLMIYAKVGMPKEEIINNFELLIKSPFSIDIIKKYIGNRIVDEEFFVGEPLENENNELEIEERINEYNELVIEEKENKDNEEEIEEKKIEDNEEVIEEKEIKDNELEIKEKKKENNDTEKREEFLNREEMKKMLESLLDLSNLLEPINQINLKSDTILHEIKNINMNINYDKSIFKRKRVKSSKDKLIENLKNNKYSDSQIEVLNKALDEKIPLEFINKIASPDIPASNMNSIRKIYNEIE